MPPEILAPVFKKELEEWVAIGVTTLSTRLSGNELSAYAQLDRLDDAEAHRKAVLTARPDFSLERYRSHIVYVRDEDRDHIVDGLQKAGLPD